MHIVKHCKLCFAVFTACMFVITNSSDIYADGLACANTTEGYFIIFDKGKIIRQDHNHAQKYWVRNNFIVFVDFLNSLQVYYNNRTVEITNGISDITVDDSMFVWNVAGVLRAWRQGEMFLINNYVSSFYKISEGSVAYIDDYEKSLNIWYEGKSWMLEQNSMEMPMTSLQLSSKTVAWQTPDFQFKVFIDGEIIGKPVYKENFEYKTGAGFCVFVEPSTLIFEKFTAEGVYEMETTPIKWYTTKYNKLAYISWENNLKIVDGDLTTSISNTEPDIFNLTLFGVYYNELQQVIYFESPNDRIILDYIPMYYYFFNSVFVFRDNSGVVQVWNDGKRQTPALSPSAVITPITDVIVITDAQKTSFWYNGQIYDFFQ